METLAEYDTVVVTNAESVMRALSPGRAAVAFFAPAARR
jgi:hypothetical protein